MIQVIDPVLKAVTITLSSSIQLDSVEIARTNNAATFQKGQLADVQTFLNETTGPEIDYLTTIWA